MIIKSPIISALFWSLLLSIGIYNTVFEIDSVNLVFYSVICKEKISAVAFPVSLAFSIWLIAMMFAYAVKTLNSPDTITRLNRALLPLLLMPSIFLLPIAFHMTFIFIAVIGVSLFRYFLLFQPDGICPRWEFQRQWPALLILLALSMAFIGYGFYVQKKAFDTAYISWGDWGYFYESLHNTLNGRWFWLNKLHINFLGSRFCPGLIILLPYMKFFGSPYAFFLMSSTILASGGILVYLLGRGMNFTVRESMIFGVIYFLIPGFFNMNLCLTYGFHEIYFTIPTVLLAFYFYERKKYTPALLFFLGSMTFQETIPVLWLGFGVVALLKSRFRLAAILIVVSLAYFYFANQIAVPYFRGEVFNASVFRYEHLGNTMGEIALSPLTKPDAFWGSLLRPGTFYFLAILLLPVFILTLSFPLGLAAAGLLFMFLCIEKTDQTQNIMLHYQTMMLEVIIINMLYCYRRLKDGEISPWFKWLSWLVPVNNGSNACRNAGLFATFFTALLCFFIYSNTHFSKNPLPDFNAFSDCRPAVSKFGEFIPPGTRVSSTLRMAAHFCVRNDVYHDLNPSQSRYPIQEYVLLDLLDPLSGNTFPLRDYLLKTKNYKLIHSYGDEIHFILLLKQQAVTSASPDVSNIPRSTWPTFGIPITLNDDNFSARWKIKSQSNQTTTVQVGLRVENPVDNEVVIRIALLGEKQSLLRSNIFGKGWYPLRQASPGDTYLIEYTLPKEFGLQAVQIMIEKTSP